MKGFLAMWAAGDSTRAEEHSEGSLNSPKTIDVRLVKGTFPVNAPEMSAPEPAQLARASTVLAKAGVHIMALEGGATIGVWSDLDGPEVRAALRTLGSDGLPVRYLDGAGIPIRYKLRRVEGEQVPMSVPAEMERRQSDLMEGRDPMKEIGPIEGAYPWMVRDRMLNEMGWSSKEISWAQWKAAALNRLFQEQGPAGEPGRITAETVRHGERGRIKEISLALVPRMTAVG